MNRARGGYRGRKHRAALRRKLEAAIRSESYLDGCSGKDMHLVTRAASQLVASRGIRVFGWGKAVQDAAFRCRGLGSPDRCGR